MPAHSDQEKLPGKVMAAAHLHERREGRYAMAIEIDVSGIDGNGNVFHEHTATIDVSEWGCGFVLSVELKADDIIALHVASSNRAEPEKTRQWLFQVRRVSKMGDAWLVGAWKMDEGNVWGIDFEKSVKPDDSDLESRKDKTPKLDQRVRKDTAQ